ncbi:twin-arginine translocation signal domain-containing protein [Lichenicoccus roseus]|uniref:Twin-arginine translocation signal domain-containing protein n=1 Tax=Lichenicoccus roseus TaxID=2683649 RepID=A0A5R9J041_9PROT|nr:twin-arginine translocation signal domain-containing protein [Lichenicoccus roseus]TLU70892.1 twin-arginine translocation signal domain-containing protein [Lichenicoccus roseus]
MAYAHDTTRRDVLAALGATGLAGIIITGIARPDNFGAPTIDRDQRLLDMAAELQATERERNALNLPWAHRLDPAPRHVVDKLSALSDHAEALREMIAALPAEGARGRAAKARVALEQIHVFAGGLTLDANEMLLASLCEDVLSAETRI